MLDHAPRNTFKDLQTLDAETGIFLIVFVNRILQSRKILENIFAEFCTVNAGQGSTRLERNLDAVDCDVFLDRWK